MSSEEHLPSATGTDILPKCDDSPATPPETFDASAKQQSQLYSKPLLGSPVPPKYTGQAGKANLSQQRQPILHSLIPKYDKRRSSSPVKTSAPVSVSRSLSFPSPSCLSSNPPGGDSSSIPSPSSPTSPSPPSPSSPLKSLQDTPEISKSPSASSSRTSLTSLPVNIPQELVESPISIDPTVTSVGSVQIGSSPHVYKGVLNLGAASSPTTKRRPMKGSPSGSRIPSPSPKNSRSSWNTHRNSTGSANVSQYVEHKPPIAKQQSLSHLPVASEPYSRGMKRSFTTPSCSEPKSSMMSSRESVNVSPNDDDMGKDISNNNVCDATMLPEAKTTLLDKTADKNLSMAMEDQNSSQSKMPPSDKTLGVPMDKFKKEHDLTEDSINKNIDVQDVINNPEYPEIISDISDDGDDFGSTQSPIEDTSVMISSFSEHLDRLAKLYDAEKLGGSYPQPPKSFTMTNLAFSDQSSPSSPTPGSHPYQSRAKKLIKRSSSSLSDSPALLSQRQRALWVANSRTHPNITVYKGSWCMRNGILSVRSQEKLNEKPTSGLNEFSTTKKSKDIGTVFEEPKNPGLNMFADNSLTSLATRKIVKCASMDKNLNIESESERSTPMPRRFGLLEKCRSFADFSGEERGLNMFNMESDRTTIKRKNDDDFDDWPSASIITRIRMGRSRSVS